MHDAGFNTGDITIGPEFNTQLTAPTDATASFAGVKFGTAAACNAKAEATLRYESAGKKLQLCTGTT
jgi:hypothetical protein